MATELVEAGGIDHHEKVPRGVMLFNKWSYDGVQISDLAVEDCITATASKHATSLPHTAGRYQAKRFGKAQCPNCLEADELSDDARMEEWEEADGSSHY